MKANYHLEAVSKVQKYIKSSENGRRKVIKKKNQFGRLDQRPALLDSCLQLPSQPIATNVISVAIKSENKTGLFWTLISAKQKEMVGWLVIMLERKKEVNGCDERVRMWSGIV